MTKKHYLIVFIALFATITACGEDSDDGGDNNNAGENNAENNTNNNTGEPKVTLTTYNVGLAAGFVPYAADRLAPVAEALTQDPSDVLCLQEVWTDDEIDAIEAATSDSFPHSYVFKTENTETNAGCTPEEVTPLETCFEANCADIPQDELATCGLTNCGDEFSSTTSACQSCIAANLDKPLEGIIMACEGGGPKFAYGGHNGLMLLSRHPLADTEHMQMPSVLTQRSALRATVQIPDMDALQVTCTHLAADLDINYPEDGEAGSFEAEQASQIDLVMTWIDESGFTGNTFLLGDMNTGAAKADADINAELPDNFKKFTDAGWTSPFADSDDALCTFCTDNTVVGGADDKGGVLIDHILIPTSQTDTVSSVSRVYDQLQPIEVNTGTETETLDLHLSDHYGVRIEVTP